MKNKNQITFFALALFAITLTSCQKDFLPDTTIEASPVENNTDLTSEVSDWKSDADNILTSTISIELEVTPCATGGVNVAATSDEADLSSNEYTVNWYKNTEQTIYSNGQILECVCQFGVRVEVLNMLGEVIAEGSMDLPAC